MHRQLVFASTLLVMGLIGVECARTPECEVCVSFLQKFIDSLDADTKSSTDAIETAIRSACGETHGKDQRFCYYIGGRVDSAASILGELSKPLSWGMPAEKLCERLGKADSQICELKYDKSIDWKTVDLSKLRVKELKKILGEWGEECRGCTEKSEYVKLIQELKPKFVRDEL